MKINANFRVFAATNFDATQYISSPSYGVNRFMLDRIGNEIARATTIVQYQPNSKFPKHIHIGGEEFLVLEGTFKDQYGEFPSGTYVRNPIGTEHEPWVDNDGCTIMVKLLQMAESLPNEVNTPLHVNVSKVKDTCGKSSEAGIIAELYKNENTGEKVEMCWINPDTLFPTNLECTGGEELFVVSGSLVLGSDNDTKTIYNKWGWLRFPPHTEDDNQARTFLRTGSSGAQVYRKTGHLTDKALAMEKIQSFD